MRLCEANMQIEIYINSNQESIELQPCFNNLKNILNDFEILLTLQSLQR